MLFGLDKSNTSQTPSAEMAIAVLVTMAHDSARHGELSHAEALFKRAWSQAERYFGAHSITLATILWDLSSVYERQGRLDEADELGLQVKEILQIYKETVLRRQRPMLSLLDAAKSN